MTGHTHKDIDSFFSTIASKLRSGIICPVRQSFDQAVSAAFDDPKDKPVLCYLNACDIFDYKELYSPLVDKTIAYHPGQQPHQFHIKHYDASTVHVLLHYKRWSHSRFWLPMSKHVDNSSFPTPMDSIDQENAYELPLKLKLRHRQNLD